MRAQLTPQRLLAVVGFAFSCFVLLLYLWLKSGGAIPLAPEHYQVHVPLPQAKGLGPHSDVRVSGVTVGHVIHVKAGKPTSAGRADVLIDLEPEYVPLRGDARAMLRGKSIIGEAYVALSLGSEDAPPVPDGGALPADQALTTVESDQIFGTYDARTRRALQQWLQAQGPALEARGYDLNAGVASFQPWMVDAERLLGIVEEQSASVQTLLDAGGDVAEGLADREQALQLLARAGDQAFNATGRQGAALEAAFRELPGFEREARVTTERLTAFAEQSTDDIAAVKRELAPLSPALEELSADAPALRAIVESTPALARAGRRGLPALDRVLESAPPMLTELDPFLRSLNPALRYIGDGRNELTMLIANFAAATQTATSTPNSKEPVHYLRAMPVLGPTVLGPMSRRPGASRTNPYPPLASLDLLNGYPSWDTSHCGNATPYISDEPSPYIDEGQREQIRLYAFGGDPANPPRPACRAQGTGFPSLGTDAR